MSLQYPSLHEADHEQAGPDLPSQCVQRGDWLARLPYDVLGFAVEIAIATRLSIVDQ
jgi:hypothetical protein